MTLLLHIASWICLLVIMFQDFRERMISWLTLPLLFILCLFMALQKSSLADSLLICGVNSAFVLLQLLCLSIWFSIKERRWVNIADTMLGWGDILFFLAITAAFGICEYMMFYLGGLVLTLIFFLMIRLFKKDSRTDIPLAGALSILMIIYQAASLLNPAFHLL